MPDRKPGSKRRLTVIVGAFAPAVTAARLLLAVKSAIAVALAWIAGSLLPGAVDDYAFYAPLGAIISMMPTIMGSLRTSLQSVGGLALGIGTAWAIIALGIPGIAGVAIAVGLGVVLAGIRGLGPGRDYVPITALFVLLLGGAAANQYAIGYISQMGVGMIIGVAVNLLLLPPLRLTQVSTELSQLRTTMADILDDIARALVEEWPPDHSGWTTRMSTLNSLVDEAAPVIADARESQRLNPRAKRHRHDASRDSADLDAIAVLTRHLLDLGEAISGAIWKEPVSARLPDELCEPISAAIAGMADLIRAWDAREQQAGALEAAADALRRLNARYDDYQSSTSQPTETVGAVVFSLRRVLITVESRLDQS